MSNRNSNLWQISNEMLLQDDDDGYPTKNFSHNKFMSSIRTDLHSYKQQAHAVEEMKKFRISFKIIRLMQSRRQSVLNVIFEWNFEIF